MLGWLKHKLESRVLGEISITSAMQMTPRLYGRMQRGAKEPLDEVQESGKAGLKLNIQKTKIMISTHITSWKKKWGNNGNNERLCFLELQIIADGDSAMKLKDACSLEEKL